MDQLIVENFGKLWLLFLSIAIMGILIGANLIYFFDRCQLKKLEQKMDKLEKQLKGNG